ncbi:hypothetical protein HDIA_0360 [Hartmannibacter diazotrophicus]|uniref:Carbon monoxide dehydrogenase subunit G (CoxG) n=1 Tax=Hartmannibacter diazotrophicus TaxID=1482074 RepID=A0A2C9D280_9HYPH|nr:SRPBCC family protein [Hartmannibacter diazotrophicus]SON53901.1 hypothetical protein HDIA_0360 [Hartmannibacter diazotrophicus]
MEIKNTFDVPLPPNEAWPVLMDIPRIVPCVPGAELVEVVDERTFKGKVAVKLGPIALVFNGTARFEDIDEAAHKANVKVQGTDTKGRGGANATVAFSLQPSEQGSRVYIVTDVALSGMVAQYGRGTGVIQGVAAQLINQFAASLREMLEKEGALGAPTGGIAGADPAVSAEGDTSTGAAPVRTESSSSLRTEPAPAPKPISGFALLLSVLKEMLRGLFGGRKRD